MIEAKFGLLNHCGLDFVTDRSVIGMCLTVKDEQSTKLTTCRQVILAI